MDSRATEEHLERDLFEMPAGITTKASISSQEMGVFYLPKESAGVSSKHMADQRSSRGAISGYYATMSCIL
jgi:hypothetical protein